MSFETEAEVHLTIPSDDLRNVRQQIEESVGTTEVGVTDGGSMSAQAAGGGGRGGRARRRARREFRWARERTDYLEDAVVYLESIDDSVGDGGGGFGGVIGELIGAGAETAGDAAIEAGDTIADAITDTATTALGNAVADAITNNQLNVEDTSLTVEEPGWTPIAVDDPSPFAVETPDAISVDAPSAIDVDDPSPLDVTDPSPLGVDDPSPLTVESVDPLEVEDVGPIGVNVDGQAEDVDTDRPNVGVDVSTPGGRPPAEPSDDGGFPGALHEDLPLTETREEAIRTSTELVAGEETADDVLSNIGAADRGTRRAGGQPGTATASPQSVELTVDQTFDTEVVVDELRDFRNETLSEIEGMVDDAFDELESELDSVRSDIDDLERQITRNGR